MLSLSPAALNPQVFVSSMLFPWDAKGFATPVSQLPPVLFATIVFRPFMVSKFVTPPPSPFGAVLDAIVLLTRLVVPSSM